MAYIYEIRRIKRKPQFESWIMYTSDGKQNINYDYVYIFFEDNNCTVFLFIQNIQALSIEKYATTLESIYHDIGISESNELLQDLQVIEIPKNILNDDDKIEKFIKKTIGYKIKEIEN